MTNSIEKSGGSKNLLKKHKFLFICTVIFIVLAAVGSYYLIREEPYIVQGSMDDFLRECEQAESQGECLTDLAIDSRDVSLCDKLEDEGSKDDCYNLSNSLIGDIVACEKVQNETIREGCYLRLAIRKKDLSFCEKINYQFALNECYLKTAAFKKDTSICDRLPIQTDRDFCYGYASHDISVCETIEEKPARSKELCYLEIAEASQNASICKIAKEQSWREACYVSVAWLKEDSSLCRLVADNELKDDCYKYVAIERKTPSLCEKVQGEQSKDRCYYFAK